MPPRDTRTYRGRRMIRMQIAKTIEELYEEAKKYDVVITTDAALATALNARVDEPRLDGFAYTAKQIAAMREGFTLGGPVMSDLEIVRRIAADTDLSFRFIYSEILNIRDIWKYTSDVENYLHSARARKVWQSYRLLPTKERSMSGYVFEGDSFFKGKKVAAIGLDFFNNLDKCMNINGIDEIELFKGGDYEIGTIYAAGNDRQCAECAVDLIDGNIDPTDVAIILDSDSPAADAVRAALYRKRIPFKNNLSMKDLSQVRDFLQFIDLAHGYSILRVSDVRDLFSGYGAGDSRENPGLSTKLDGYLLHKMKDKVKDPMTILLLETMEHLNEYTYGAALDIVMSHRKNAAAKTSVEILLKDVGIYDEKITQEKTSEVIYAVNNVEDLRHNEQIPENEKMGVLLADCRNSAYVDRPLVIFIGMDSGWDADLSGREYADIQAEAEKNAVRMNVLLQQGDCRMYIVKPVSGGKPTQPCRHITDLFRDSCGNPIRKIDGFRDICSEYKEGCWHIAETEKEFPRVGVEVPDAADERDRAFSKTSYNAFSDCPIKFLFKRLLKSEESEYTVFGNCLHEFAELYLCYPEVVKEKGTDYYLDRMDSLYSGMSSECEKELDRSKFSIYISNLMRYIDAIRPENVPLDIDVSEREYPNSLMEEEGLTKYSRLAESGLSFPEDRIYAKFDVCIGSEIFDYKTGKPKSGLEIAKGFDRGNNKYCEFQPLIYLAALNKSLKKEEGTFNQFYIGDNDIDSTEDGFDVMQNVRRVKIVGTNHDDFVTGAESPVKEAYANARDKKFVTFWDDIAPRIKEEMKYGGWSESQALTDRISAITGYAASTVGTFLKKMSEPITVGADGTVYVPLDTLDHFIEQLTADYRESLRIRTVPFKDVSPGKLDCDKCEYRNACMAAENKESEEEGE